MHVAKPAQLSTSRMSLQNITRGRQERPLRVLLYGVEGVGKSTFASCAPNPIFLCSEDGTSHLDVARLPFPRNWADVLEAVRVLTHEEHSFKSLVIDTLDWLEPLCWAAVCSVAGKNNIEEFGYGKGYVLAAAQWRELANKLDLLVRTRKINVILLAHAQVKRQEDPITGPFDRYRLKVHEKSSEIFREWVDAVLFARHETRVVTDTNTKRPRGQSNGRRVMMTTWTAAYDAKNRFDLPDALPLSWEDLEQGVKAHRPADPTQMKAEIVSLIPRLPAEDQAQAQKTLTDWAGDNAARLAQLLDRVHSKIALAAPAEAPAATQGEG